MSSRPIVWSVAGSDPSGGAGIQADLKVFHEHLVQGATVITALTAQNSLGVSAMQPVAPPFFSAQLEALASDMPPVALKAGMLATLENAQRLYQFLENSDPFFVLDPVLVSTSGKPLLEPDAVDFLRSTLLIRADLITPNLPEAQLLTGRTDSLGEALLEMGARAVLLKGGHREGDQCVDFLFTGDGAVEHFSAPRIETTCTHGTGCVLSSAITANLARGASMADAVARAKEYLTEKLRTAEPYGAGNSGML